MARSVTTWIFAIGNALIAAMMLTVVFGGLSTRWWAVDIFSVLLAGMLLLSAFGLARASGWALAALRACALVELLVGVLAIAALTFLAGYLGHSHELGRTGLMTLIVGLTLCLPYWF